jgi:acetyl-CoA acyltransferase
MADVFICDYVRTPIGRYGGSLAMVRPDDLAATVLRVFLERQTGIDWDAVDDVIFGCVCQSGEDSRNVARMALLLAGLPVSVPGSTVNRLCGSGMNAVISGANAIRGGEAEIVIAGGVESMTRAPLIVPKAETAFSRATDMYDSTIGWRFVNPLMEKMYGIDSMPETAENVARQYRIGRDEQDAFAARSQQKAVAAQENGRFAQEITPVVIPQRKGGSIVVDRDEHPRPGTTAEALSRLPAPFVKDGATVTAGNASGINDGAAALVLASEAAARKYGLTPIARVVGGAMAGVEPRVMGIGPAPATRKLCARIGWKPSDFDVVEANEAFAAQAIAILRDLGLPEDGEHVNPNGGAIALGHPLGMTGARITGSAALELVKRGEKKALATMCIGVGQGISVALERV